MHHTRKLILLLYYCENNCCGENVKMVGQPHAETKKSQITIISFFYLVCHPPWIYYNYFSIFLFCFHDEVQNLAKIILRDNFDSLRDVINSTKFIFTKFWTYSIDGLGFFQLFFIFLSYFYFWLGHIPQWFILSFKSTLPALKSIKIHFRASDTWDFPKELTGIPILYQYRFRENGETKSHA